VWSNKEERERERERRGQVTWLRPIKFIKNFSRKILKRRKHMGDLGIVGRIMFQEILKK
jgi:hypothetical protein